MGDLLLHGLHLFLHTFTVGAPIRVLLEPTGAGGPLYITHGRPLVGPTPVILRGSVLGLLLRGQPHIGIGSMWVLIPPPLMTPPLMTPPLMTPPLPLSTRAILEKGTKVEPSC